ncbi:protein phosphatase 2C domain-containing protein [Anabaena sp. FACHB-1237]|uniref:protein phosphatase 2C domain-containing protein n=1 Tax=Anabaena sp. FACHB-1237 TaxID=2692769 RepID=UPI001680F601|nr:protein phosphatase 2C domain-containing protein [Anabaena sp. FACHB-1237]MBD2137512.1 protein phosphatase 2C domain-containing protein [Anabaena sp. FACHB-1237]
MPYNQLIINCPNPECEQPINIVGETNCHYCQTPLIYRYLWAIGKDTEQIPVQTKVADRYEVIKPQIWLDSKPSLSPDAPSELPEIVIPYSRLYSQNLHIPQAYGFTNFANTNSPDISEILLLENVPIDETGNIYPSIHELWSQTSRVRKIYWLWQILNLWQPLSELGVSQSLLIPENLRVQGWCVRLLQLYQNPENLRLQHLGEFWQDWLGNQTTDKKILEIIDLICQPEIEFSTISNELNSLLLMSAARLPLYLSVAGGTDTGPVIKHNEDACYPNNVNLYDHDYQEVLQSKLSIVCDGIGGHAGGEVASQLALKSLKLQVQAFLVEVEEQKEIMTPKLIKKQLESCLRVVNNVVWYRNDEQHCQGKERMATTLVMAVQIPQKVFISDEYLGNSHELYLAHIGDSRAYWITNNSCQLLTVDDDLIKREVSTGRSLYWQALQKPDAHALTQALGTKESEFINFTIQRFIIEEDGILLLCSDGLSDHNLLSQYWQDYAIPVLTGDLKIEDATQELIKLANEKNAQDNISVVLTLYRVSQPSNTAIVPAPPAEILAPQPLTIPDSEALVVPTPIKEELAPSSQALLDLTMIQERSPRKSRKVKGLIGLFLLLLGSGGLSLFTLWQISPQSFSQMCRQLPQKVREFCPSNR